MPPAAVLLSNARERTPPHQRYSSLPKAIVPRALHLYGGL